MVVNGGGQIVEGGQHSQGVIEGVDFVLVEQVKAFGIVGPSLIWGKQPMLP